MTTLISGVLSACISIAFREYEVKAKKILLGTQFFIQLIALIVMLYLFGKFFSGYTLDVGLFTLNWVFIYLIFSSVSYYGIQVLYELSGKKTLFPTDQEIEEYIERNSEDI